MVCVLGLKLKNVSLDFSMVSKTLLLPAECEALEYEEEDLDTLAFAEDFVEAFFVEETDFSFVAAGRPAAFFFTDLRAVAFLAAGAELLAAVGLGASEGADAAGLDVATLDERLEGDASEGFVEIELADVC